MLSQNNTFVINLPERTDRLIAIREELMNAGIGSHTILATKHVDGRMGLCLTMQKLFKECIENDDQSIMVFEDDAVFINNPAFINKSISELPEDFDLLYLGGYLIRPPRRRTKHLGAVTGIYSTHAIYYSRKGMEKALKLLNDTLATNNSRPYDQLLVSGIQQTGKCFCSLPAILKQRAGWSDIEKRDVDYTRYHEETFEKYTAHLKSDNLP